MLKSCPCAFFAEFFTPHPVCCNHGTFLVVASELVASCLEHLIVALVNTELLHAPRLSSVDIHACVVSGNAPVGADYTLVSVSVIQKILDDISAECIGDILS